MAKIIVQNLSVAFDSYGETPNSFKEMFANLVKNKKNNKTEFLALNNVSIEINAGERVGIIGKNGAGKSTLLKSICRVYESDRGLVKVSGRIAPLLEIGAGFQPDFTGRENIYLNSALLGLTKDQIQKHEQEIIDFSGIGAFIDTPVKYYSTGMYLRLAFSLATAVEAEVLILDELFAGGDAEFVDRARKRVYSMIDNAKIFLLVSHDNNLLADLCERVIWLDKGCVVEDGPARIVIEKYISSCS